MSLLVTTIEGLLLGHRLDRESWLQLASQLDDGQADEERALLALARIATVEDLGSLDRLLNTIPATDHPARAIGAALAATRSLDLMDASSLSRLAMATYELLPCMRERAHLQPAVERVADLQACVIELRGEQLDPLAACWFTNLANTLSLGMENHRYLDAAFALADRLHPFPTGGTSTEKSGRYLAASNLVTTCKQLAKRRPSMAERYLLRGVAIASSLYECRQDMQGIVADPHVALRTIFQALQNLMFMHGELARVSPAHAAQHTADAWARAACLRNLVEQLEDPDLRREAETAEAALRKQVGPEAASRRTDDATIPMKGLERTHAMIHASRLAAEQVLQLAPGAERDRAITEHVVGLYGELARRLVAAIAEVGVNRHVSRFLLGLGAMASGRLWPLALPAISDCIMGEAPEEGASYRHATERNQELPPRRSFEPESSYFEHVCALAMFGDTLSIEEDLAGMLQALLRERNRELLRAVLSAARPRHVPHRKLSRMIWQRS